MTAPAAHWALLTLSTTWGSGTSRERCSIAAIASSVSPWKYAPPSSRSLAQAEPAVHQELSAAAITRIGAQQERHGPSHFVGLGKAVEHDPRQPLAELVRFLSQQRRGDIPR